MKTITFFNEKGGVGKSSFAIMYASWLYYVHHINVAVIDFNSRLSDYREDEINYRKELEKKLLEEYHKKLKRYEESLNKDSGTTFKVRKPAMPVLPWNNIKDIKTWPIIQEDRTALYQLKKVSSTRPYTIWFQNLIHNEELKGYDVVILDFAGSVEDRKWLDLISSDNISLTVIPVDRDPQTINSSIRTYNLIKKFKGRKSCAFLNQVNLSIRNKDEYSKSLISIITEKAGISFLPDMISFSERMKKISEIDIMRSTFEYPNWGKGSFKDSEDIGIDNLFIDVTKLLNKADDILSTPKTDLSFVNTLEKKADKMRQFTGSAFPEFEI